MFDGILLMDRAYYCSAEWLNQKNDGFGRGAAWQDLLALTNQKATTTLVRNREVTIERGQCAWSKLGLSDRWGRSQAWVTATLTTWEQSDRIKLEKVNETTVISIVNYDAYQTGMSRQICEEYPSAKGDNREMNARSSRDEREMNARSSRDEREMNETEKGEGRREYSGSKGVPSTEYTPSKERREKGEGRGADPPPTEMPSDREVSEFAFQWPGDISRGIPAGIPETWWTGWVANRITEKKWPADWRRVLVLAFRSDFGARHFKALGGTRPNGPPNAETNAAGLSANVAAIQNQARHRVLDAELQALENQVDQDRRNNQPPNPSDRARLKKLRAEVAALALVTPKEAAPDV
jgi:hypothetical protein